MDQSTTKTAKSIVKVCSPSDCLDNQDENHLVCVLCKRKVHYECSKLPAYEIQRIISSTSNPYKCITCVRVPKALTKILNENKYQTVNKEIQEKDSIIKQLRQELSMKTNARNIIRNDLESFLSEKISEFETKTREIIKEELNPATTVTKPSVNTYAEITKEKRKEIKNIIREQSEEDKREEIDIKSRKNTLMGLIFAGIKFRG